MTSSDSRIEWAVARLPALRSRNFRRYMAGQVASIAGTWLQSVALGWLVLKLTHDGSAVGLVTAAQFAPALILGVWAGAVADRFDARRAVMGLQVLLGAQAASLAVLVFTDHASLWSLCLLAMVQGVGNAFDQPLRQALMNETVGDRELPNAIATNSMLVQIGLILGPSLAAVLIPTVGIGWCFAVNAASYAVMLVAIRSIRPDEMVRRPRSKGADASVRAGLVYLRQRRDIRFLLVVLAAGSMLAYRLEVVLPVLASRDLHGGSALFAVMTASRGLGALGVSLYLASRIGPPPFQFMRRMGLVMAAGLGLMAVPFTPVVLVALVPVGLGMLGSVGSTLALTQLLASPEFRGRVVAVWFVVMNGGVVFGALFTGALVEHLGTRETVLIGAGTMLVLWAILGRSARVLEMRTDHLTAASATGNVSPSAREGDLE